VGAGVATLWFGVVQAYEPATHRVKVKIDKGNGQAYITPWSPICSPFWGPTTSGSRSYGLQGGTPLGAQALVGVVDEQGNLFVVFGFCSNSLDPGQGTPSDEFWLQDVRGSFLQLIAKGGGSLRAFATGIASFFGGSRTEIGGENLDTSQQAVIRKSDLDAALVRQVAMLQAQLSAWAGSSVQGGMGASGPTLSPIQSTGSTKVTSA
jgi:hypothetical protein